MDNFPSQNITNKIEITNPKIVKFYRENPHINIDEINLYFINMMDKDNSSHYSILPPFFFNPPILSSIQSETKFDKIHQPQSQPRQFINVLSRIFPTADIIQKFSDNIISMKRMAKSTILLKNIDIDSNVSNEQITFFANFIEQENCCGIVLSQNSGISNKNHFQIDIQNNNIVIYIHNVQYSESIITSAVDIIDSLYFKIQEFCKQSGEHFAIPREVLDNINSEYQSFVLQKSSIVDTVKEYSKKILSQIDNCKFSSLNAFLFEKYPQIIIKSEFHCKLCNNYSANNLKGLAAHKRGCLRKNLLI